MNPRAVAATVAAVLGIVLLVLALVAVYVGQIGPAEVRLFAAVSSIALSGVLGSHLRHDQADARIEALEIALTEETP